MQHTCSLCQKEFKAKAKNRRYCSRKCFEARNKHLTKRECLACGAILITYLNWIKRGGGKYCSTKCGGVARDKKIEKNCLQCGSRFKVKKSTSIHNASKYCSPKCGQLASRGSNHPNWNGGSSKLPYSFCFNDALKEEIRKRDDYECQICNMQEEEHLLLYGQSLPVHHIDYDKKNSSFENLISLCNQCHGRTNFNRQYWQDYFLTKKEK